MGRGRSSSGSRGFSSSSRSRGSSSSSSRSWGRSSRTTVIVGGSRYYGSSYGSSSGSGQPVNSRTSIIVTGAVMLLIGIFFLLMGFVTVNSGSDYGTVQGKAVDNTYMGGYYYTTYEYFIDGTEYSNRSDVGWEHPETLGVYVTIYYLKDNPNFITDEEPTDIDGDFSDSAIFFILGGVFTVIGLILLVKGIQTKKEKPETALNIDTSPTVEDDGKVKCPYCGTKYDKNLSSCPNCGASNK